MLFSRVAVVLCLASGVFGQQRVDPRNMYERVIAVVPMIGKGTYADPKRPTFVPDKPSPDGIMAFTCETADDGQLAICEFVARDRKELLPILQDARLKGRVFEKGRARKEDIETELKKHKRDFDLNRFGAGPR